MFFAKHDAERECVENTRDKEDNDQVKGSANSWVLYPECSYNEFRVGT